MKAYDLAKSLNYLARVLRAGPNVEVDEIANLSTHLSKSQPKKPASKQDATQNGAALAVLAAMSSLTKSEVLQMAEDLEIPLQVRKADAVRDILGKMLRYIQDNPEVQDRLVSNSVHSSEQEAPRLARALAILMDR